MAAGQSGMAQRSNRSVTKIDLGISSLTLEVGESYTFNVTYEPENTAFPYLRWYSSDDTVVGIDGIHFTVTALSPGSAVIYTESLDSVSHAVCSVQVNGVVGKDAADLLPGSELVSLTETEIEKITSGPLKSFMGYVLSTDFSPEAYQKAVQREFIVAADVVPGTEKSESQKALSLGMAASYPLENLNMITLQGTFEQIMTFAAGDPDLLELFGGEYYFPETRHTGEASETDDSGTQKIEGHTEEITHVSIAHNLGYTGEGITIAVLDTGLNSSHEQFQGRVLREKCFTSTTAETMDTIQFQTSAVCTGGTTESDSALPEYSLMGSDIEGAYSFNHGSHTGGVAAGKDGIAPDASIVPVLLFSWGEYTCGESSEGSPVQCHVPVEVSTDKYRAYDFILGLKNEGIRVDIVSMSYGDSSENDGYGFPSVCDTVRPKDAFSFRRMTEAGIIPVGASGNGGFDNGVIHPACDSDVFSVGACFSEDVSPEDPAITDYSNHSRELVDILAPGNDILSAALFDPESLKGQNELVLSENAYDYDLGTSMAAPMVSGAFALLKQAVPGRTVSEYKQLILDISRLSTDIRKTPVCAEWDESEENCIKIVYSYDFFEYKKTVLNFDGFPEVLENISAPVTPAHRSLLFYRLGSVGILPRTGFSALKPREISVQPLSVQYKPAHMTIQLPTLDVKSEIVTVPFTGGEYPVEWLGDTVGMLEGSSLPGEGFTVLTGHNHLNTTEAGPFALLGSLEPGDRFMITDELGIIQTWHVYKNTKIPAGGFSDIVADVKDNTLVLLTCEDESPTGGYLNRRVVLAEL